MYLRFNTMEKEKKEKKHLFNLFGKLLLKTFDNPPHPLQRSENKVITLSQKNRETVSFGKKIFLVNAACI